jgi:1,4-dihydroxy-2-naphthoate octaprenyltransferase
VTTAGEWVAGARPRTLPAAVVPVAVGTACAAGAGDVVAWRAVAALVVSLALQVGTNYVNDYADGVRGTDDVRVGPLRLVASGTASATAVRAAALVAFAVAAVAGLALTLAVGPELLVVGVLSIAAGWFYTAGPKPYGYLGLGEVFVFVFFGLVATIGSAYVHVEHVTAVAVWASLPVGLLVTSLLVVNNLRDIPTDAASGKRTLAVRLGDAATRRCYAALVLGAYVLVIPVAVLRPPAAIALIGVLLAAGPVAVVLQGAKGRELIPVLGATGRVHLATGLLLAIGLWIGA